MLPNTARLSLQCRQQKQRRRRHHGVPADISVSLLHEVDTDDIRRLRFSGERKDEEGVAGALPSVLLDPSQLTPAVPQLISNLRTLYDSFYPELSCDREVPITITATSDLWGTKRLNVSNAMKLWNHIDGQNEIVEFFTEAAESRAGTLAHVVLTRKKASDDAYATCVNDEGIDMCQHGHLSVVFEHVYASDTTQNVVSVGFFPATGNAWNAMPGFPDDGLVQIPDPMVSNWRSNLAHVNDNDDNAKIQDFVTVLNTFVYSPQKMKQWLAILNDHYYDTIEEDVPPETFVIPGLKYSMYGGVAPLSSLSSLAGSLVQLEDSMRDLSKKLPIVSKNKDFPPMNCATYVLAAFPEANLTCTLGVPILCSKAEEEESWFEDLSSGVKEMADDAVNLLGELDTQVYRWVGAGGYARHLV